MEAYTHEDMRQRLKALVAEAGSQTAAAKTLHISEGYLNDILKGNRQVSATVALRLGYRREIRFVEK